MAKPTKPFILMIGPQGSGKGTQGDKLSKLLQIPRISTGELLRIEVERGSALGRRIRSDMDAGIMINDADTSALLRDRLGRMDCHDGWILDGFPRRLTQAQLLNSYAEPNLAIVLMINTNQAVKRLADRVQCEHGHVYHLKHRPPRKAGYCDLDGMLLERRPDDADVNALKRRLHAYNQETQPLIQYYQNIALLIDAAPPIDAVYRELVRRMKLIPWLALRQIS